MFSKVKGTLESWSKNGKEYLANGPMPNFWRTPTDNDFGNNMPERAAGWRKASQNQQVNDIQVTNNRYFVGIQVGFTYPDLNSNGKITYSIYGDGRILVTHSIDLNSADLPDLPKFGTRMTIPKEYDNMTWFGRGPHESYIDRKASTRVDIFSGKISEQYHPYVRPQENGNKTDVRWATFTDKDGNGFIVSGFLSLNASHFIPEDFDDGFTIDDQGKPLNVRGNKRGMHTTDLVKRDLVHLDIDHKQMGVGGEDSWGAQPLKKYKIEPKRYNYHFIMAPINANDDPMTIYKYGLLDHE